MPFDNQAAMFAFRVCCGLIAVGFLAVLIRQCRK